MMNDPALEVLVNQKIASGESEWIDRSLAIQMLAVLRSVDARLAGLDRALAANTAELRDLLREAVKLNSAQA